MNVLLVHDYGTATGGAELQMFALRRMLRERGHDARIFASTAKLVPAPIEADYACAGASGRRQVLLQTANPSAYLGLRRVLREFRPDVVHVRMFLWQLSPLILPLLQGYPTVFQAATFKCICPTGFKLLPDGTQCMHRTGLVCLRNGCVTPQTWAFSQCQLSLFRRWRQSFNAVVALSEHMRTTLERDGIAPVEVVHNGVAHRPSRPPLPDEPLIGYAGRLSREKGVDILLKAFASVRSRVPGVKLLIAGSGPERHALARLSEELGVSDAVAWLGHLSRPDLERSFDRVWVQAVPSLWNEAFGNVATEASMRGTALVCANTGGLAEIVADGETGYLVRPGDHESLEGALEKLTRDRHLADTMGAAGRRRALELFSEERCVSRLLAIYNRVIAEHTATVHAHGPQVVHD